jgi:SAM-dependent methyltransferase
MVHYTNDEEDVPSPIDLRDPADAKAWADTAEGAQPARPRMRSAIAAALRGLPVFARSPAGELRQGARILELGSGPGFLAEVVLAECLDISSYTLFDFSRPMLDMSRERLKSERTTFVLGDFKQPDWQHGLAGPYDAVVSMQAVHEIRHKRHVPALYRQIRELLRPGSPLLVADWTPKDDSLRWTSLHSTADEQLVALSSAGFTNPHVVLTIERLVMVSGNAP